MIDNRPAGELSDAELAHELRSLDAEIERSDRFESLFEEACARLEGRDADEHE